MKFHKYRLKGCLRRKISKIRKKNYLKRNEKLNPRTVRNEFHLNQFITLRLIDFGNNSTCTYVIINDRMFNLYEFSFKEILEILNERKNYTCMDEVCLHLMGTYNEKEFLADPDTMFSFYCYYIAAWVEYDYDWRLLRVDDAFPMLHALYQEGDPKAREVYKYEIIKAFLSGYLPVVYHLISSNYLDHTNYFKCFKFEEIIGLFEKCFNIVGFRNRKELVLGFFYFFKANGIKNFSNNNVQMRIKVLNEALKIIPDDIITLRLLSVAYKENGNYELAGRTLLHIINLSNSEIYNTNSIGTKEYITSNYVVEAWRILGEVYNLQLLFNKAIIACNMDMDLDWKHTNTWNQIAIAYEGKGDMYKALAARKTYKKKMTIVMKNEREVQ